MTHTATDVCGTVWVYLTDEWVDFTDRVRDVHGELGTFHGRQTVLERPAAALMTLTLDDEDGSLTPGNPNSPHYPGWDAGAPIVWQEDVDGEVVVHFAGYLGMPQGLVEYTVVDEGDGSTTAAHRLVQVSCVDTQTKLDEAPAFHSLLAADILLNNTGLIDYWPLSDAEGSRLAAPLTAGSANLYRRAVVAAPKGDAGMFFGQGDRPYGDDSPSSVLFIPNVTDGSYVQLRGTAALSGTAPTISIWAKLDSLPANTSVLVIADSTTVALRSFIVGLDSTGHWFAQASTGSGGEGGLVTATDVADVDVWQLITATFSPAGNSITLRVGERTYTDATTGSFVGTLLYNRIGISGGLNATVYLAHLQTGDGAGHHDLQYDLGRLGLHRELAHDRMRTIAEYAGLAETVDLGPRLDDDFTRDEAAGSWGAPTFVGGAYALVGTASDFDVVDSTGGRIAPSGTASDRAATVHTSAPNFDVTLTGKVSALPGSGTLRLGVVGRFTDASNFYWSELHFDSTGAAPWFYIRKMVAGSPATVDDGDPTSVIGSVTGNTLYSIRLQAIDEVLRAKVWLAADPEPAAWLLEGEDTDLTSGGRIGPFARNESAAADRTFTFASIVANAVENQLVVDTSPTSMQVAALAGIRPGAAMAAVADTDRGVLVGLPNGQLHFQSRLRRYYDASDVAVEIPYSWLGDPLLTRRDLPINRATVTQAGTGGATAADSDAASIAQYGEFTAGGEIALASTCDADPQVLASFVVNSYASPRSRLESLRFTLDALPEADQLTLLRLTLGDRIEITGPPEDWPEGAYAGSVEGRRMSVNNGQRTLVLHTAPLVGDTPGTPGPWFVLGTSELGGTDRMPF